jgi:hypothetical protein
MYILYIIYIRHKTITECRKIKIKINAHERNCNLKIFILISFMEFQWHLQKKKLPAVGWGKVYDAERLDKDWRGDFRGHVLNLHPATRSVALKVNRENLTSFWSLVENRITYKCKPRAIGSEVTHVIWYLRLIIFGLSQQRLILHYISKVEMQ